MFWVNAAIIGLAGYITWRNKPKRIRQALEGSVAYLLMFLITANVLQGFLPFYITRSQARTAQQWGSVWDEAYGEAKPYVDRAANWFGPVGDSEQTPAPDLVVETATPTAPTDAGAAPGAAAVVVDRATPAPAPTATPTLLPNPQVVAYSNALAAAKAQNDRQAAAVAIQELLAINPMNEQALQAQVEIAAAETRIQHYLELGNIQLQIAKRDDWQQEVTETLHGGSFYIVADGARTTDFACQEVATVRDETPGWTNGTRFGLPRCYLEAFVRPVKSGARFTVQ